MDYCCNQCGSGFEDLNQLKEHKKSNYKGQTFNGFKTVRGSAISISKGGAIETLARLHTANSNLLFFLFFISYVVYVHQNTRVKTLFPLLGGLYSPVLGPGVGPRTGLMQLSTVKPCPRPLRWAAALLLDLVWFGVEESLFLLLEIGHLS